MLSLSAFYLNNTAHAKRAVLLLRTWFLNEVTHCQVMKQKGRLLLKPNC